MGNMAKHDRRGSPGVRRATAGRLPSVGLLLAVLLASAHPCPGAPATLTYSYSNFFDGGLSREVGFSSYEMLLAVEEGLSLWADVVPLTFVEEPDSGPPVSDNQYVAAGHPDIRIGHHDFSGNTLAHAYFPGAGGLASDVHLDDTGRTWSERMFLTTVTHELGHAIGVDHIDGVLSIMNTTLGGANVLPGLGEGFLFQPEIDAAQEIWDAGTGEVISQRVGKPAASRIGRSTRTGTGDGVRRNTRTPGFRRTLQVQLSAASPVVRSLTLAGGQNSLEIAATGSLRVLQDLTLGVPAGGSQLVAAGSSARTLVPTDSSWETTWFLPETDDSAWDEGLTGIGFDRSGDFTSLIETDVETQMYGLNNSVYTRIEFEVPDPEQLAFMDLAMKYDDGFVAYLNGTPIASANGPGQPRWDSAATRAHSDNEAVEFEVFDVSAALEAIQPGRNILAIQGLNQRTTSSDLLVLPELRAGPLDNTLRLSGGQLHVAGNLNLASDRASRSTVQLDGGELQVQGQITTGLGQSRLEIREGTLRVLGQLDTEPTGEGGSLSVDQLELYGGQIEGLTTIEAEVLHHSGVFVVRPSAGLTILGDYEMDADAVLELTISGLPVDDRAGAASPADCRPGGTCRSLVDHHRSFARPGRGPAVARSIADDAVDVGRGD